MKTQTRTLFVIRSLGCLALGTLTFYPSFGHAQNVNYYGSYTTSISTDITKPVPDRSYFTTSVTPTADGALLGVDLYHGKLNSPVTLVLQVAINDGNGNVKAIPIEVLSDKVADNPTVFFSHREFHLDYNHMNAELAKILPAGAAHLKIGPGTPMFVLGQFWDFSHQWGGLARGGLFTMPEQPGSNTAPSGVAERRATDLDLAYTITTSMVMRYNDPKTGAGLKPGGQVKSRVEGEGKYQVELGNVDAVRKKLFELSNDPAEAAKVLGSDWTIAAELRYMKKDAAGNLLKGSDGLPIPDPQVDTYYDNKNHDAAKKGIAIRYRKTAENGYGVWNFKPEEGHVTKEGVVYRREFGIDATDDKPETIKKFADSMDPMNPFREIRDVIPGAVPSEFLNPSLVVTDTRYKFIMTHKLGLKIELSLDQVQAATHNDPAKVVNYDQSEMDIDHMSTKSNNVAGTPSNTLGFQQSGGELDLERQNFLKTLGQNSSFEGRPVMHVAADLREDSPLYQKYRNDFELANSVIVKVRHEALGEHWLPGPQKNALAARELNLISEQESSASVKRLYRRIAELEKTSQRKIEISKSQASFAECAGPAFN